MGCKFTLLVKSTSGVEDLRNSDVIEVSKGAKIRNRYNQVPHTNLNGAFAACLEKYGNISSSMPRIWFPAALVSYVLVCDNNRTVNKLVQIFSAIFPRKTGSYTHCTVAREWIILHDSDDYNMG